MATDEGETIIITAKKMTEDGGANSSVWQNTAFIRNKSTGYISGVQNNAALRKAFNELTSKDTIIVEFEFDGHKLKIMFNDLTARDMMQALTATYSVVTAALDGSLLYTISQMPASGLRASLFAFADELTGDLRAAAVQGHPINFVSDTSLGRDVAGRTSFHPDSSIDFNGDGAPDPYHTIKINPNKMFFDNNDRMNIAVVHEMFHLMEGETAEEDHIRFGTTEDPSHNTLFDKAASEFIALTRKGSKISLDGNATYGSIESLIGSQGSDNLVASSGYRGAFINAGAGDDNISLQFASSVADGGTGDDSYFISGEMGSLTIFDESGVDTLHFGSGITRQQLVVRETDGWVEIGVNSTGLNNVTPSGLTAWLVISPASDGSRAIEYVRVGGSTYTFGDILANSNHRPFLTSPPEFHSGTSAGQPLGVVSSVDLDSAALQYSVVSVTGWGQGHSWSIWNGQLYSSAPLPSYVTVSNIVIRVSDGRLYSDQTAMVHWSAKGEYVSHSPVYDRGFSGISGAAFQHDDEIAAQSLGWNVAQTGIDNIPLTQIMV